jgi:hypothetical protein
MCAVRLSATDKFTPICFAGASESPLAFMWHGMVWRCERSTCVIFEHDVMSRRAVSRHAIYRIKMRLIIKPPPRENSMVFSDTEQGAKGV